MRINPSSCVALLLSAAVFVSAQTPGAPAKSKPVSNNTIKQWTLKGPLQPGPQRISDELPLTDQGNTGKWKKFAPMWDEFDGSILDTNKWARGLQNWLGRKPAWFNPTNVTVRDGQLHLAMRKESVPREMEKLGYRDYTSAALHTHARASYGYYEVKSRAMNSGGSSSFWFKREDSSAHPGWVTEVDVFELCGKNAQHDHLCHMTLHVFQSPEDKRHWKVGAAWEAPWRFSEDYHVFGFDWSREEMRWYIDGTLVHTVENTAWHFPLMLIFDSETMPEWFGMPIDADLPSTFDIEYVRAWTH